MPISTSARLMIALIKFVERVADGKENSDTEIEALPEVARVLMELIEPRDVTELYRTIDGRVWKIPNERWETKEDVERRRK